MPGDEDRHVKAAEINDIEKRRDPAKHYVYIINVLWSDDKKQVICRRYNSFFELQTALIETYPEESGVTNPDNRILPFLPGKVLFGRSNVREVALRRKDALNEYLEKLVKLPPKISESKLVLEFLEASADDVKDLLNSGGGKRVKKESKAENISDPVILQQFVVITNFKKTLRSQVSLASGDTVEVIEKHENGWWFVCIEDEQGWAPSSYLEPVDGKSSEEVEEVDCRGKEGKYICSKGYASTMPDEASMKLGDVVDVLSKCSDGWWKVQLSNSQQGYVPSNHLKKIPKNAEGDLIKTVIKSNSPTQEKGRPIKRFETAPRKKTIRRKAQDDKLAQKTKNINVDGKSDEKTQEKIVYVASSSFKAASGQGNLKFVEGAEMEVIEKSPNGWWYVRVNNEEGWVPSNVVQRQRTQSSLPDAKAVTKAIKQLYRTVGGYKATENTGISFTPGMTVEVLEKDPCGWWFVRINNDEGWAPSTFLEEIKPSEGTNNSGKAAPPRPGVGSKNVQNGRKSSKPEEVKGEYFISLSDYKDDGDDDMLDIKKGQRILVLEKDDGGWWMGKIGPRTGWVPSNFLKKE